MSNNRSFNSTYESQSGITWREKKSFKNWIKLSIWEIKWREFNSVYWTHIICKFQFCILILLLFIFQIIYIYIYIYIYIVLWRNSQGLPTDYWFHIHLPTGRGERSSSQFRVNVVSTSSPPAIVAFLNRNYRYNLVVTHISQNILDNHRSHNWPRNLSTGDRTSIPSYEFKAPYIYIYI